MFVAKWNNELLMGTFSVVCVCNRTKRYCGKAADLRTVMDNMRPHYELIFEKIKIIIKYAVCGLPLQRMNGIAIAIS